MKTASNSTSTAISVYLLLHCFRIHISDCVVLKSYKQYKYGGRQNYFSKEVITGFLTKLGYKVTFKPFTTNFTNRHMVFKIKGYLSNINFNLLLMFESFPLPQFFFQTSGRVGGRRLGGYAANSQAYD